MSKNKLFTIGYSSFENNLLNFIEILKHFNILNLMDVRTSPYSSRYDKFDRPHLEETLLQNNIRYYYRGDSLGARPDEPKLYTNNKVDFFKLAKTNIFQKQLAKINQGVEKYSLCIMCAENDPIICHRTILICYNLKKLYPHININHIFRNVKDPQSDLISQYKIISHENLEKKLLCEYGLDQNSFLHLDNSDNGIDEAFKRKASEISYGKEDI